MKQKKYTKWIAWFLIFCVLFGHANIWMATASSGDTNIIGGYRVKENNDFILPARNKRASSTAGIKYKTDSWWIFPRATNADTYNRDYDYYDNNGLNISSEVVDTSPEDPSGYFINYYQTFANEIVPKVLEWYTVGGVLNREKLADEVVVYACRAITVVRDGNDDGTYYNYNDIESKADWSGGALRAFASSYDIEMRLSFQHTEFTVRVLDQDGNVPTGYTNKYNENMLLYGETVRGYNYPGSLTDYGYQYKGYKWTTGDGDNVIVIAEGTGTSTGDFYVDYNQITGDDLKLTFYYEETENPEPEPDEPPATPTPSPSPTPTPIPYYTLTARVSSYGGGTFDVSDRAYNQTSYSKSLIKGTKVTLVANPDSDWLFDFWRIGSTTYDQPSVGITMYSSSTATVYFRPEYITVTLDPNGGVCDAATTTVQYASTYGNIQPLPVPTRVGYDFNGWYTLKKGGSLVEDTTTVQQKYNHTLYAQWTPRDDTKYTVNHWKENVDGNGYTIAATDNLQGTSDTTVFPGVKTFDGFTSPSTQSININADGSAVLDYYYTRNSYTLSLYTGRGVASVLGAGTYKYEETVTLDATLVPGYKWLQWTGDSFAENVKNYSFSMPYENIWRMAQASPITYQVKYNPSGADGGMSNSTHTYDEGKTLTFNGYTLSYKATYDLNLPAGAGAPYFYINDSNRTARADFLGWADTAGGSVKYTNGMNVKNLTTVDGDVVDLYAVWQPGDVLLPNAYLDGYVLTGWCKNADGSGTIYAVDDEYTLASDETLYAQWSAVSYTVTFEAPGGTVSPASKTVTYNSAYGTLPVPTRVGYDFAGWYTVATDELVISSTTVTTTKNHTLIAQWSANTCTVTFDWNWQYMRDADNPQKNWSSDSMEVQCGSVYGALPQPTRDGYNFVGWYTSEDADSNGAGTRIYPSTPVPTIGSHTLYAQWQPIRITVEFDYNYNYSVWPNGN